MVAIKVKYINDRDMAPYFKYFLIFASIFCFSIACAQSDINTDKIKKLQSKKLIFLWPGIDCPVFKNTYDAYGFKIACSGSIDTRTINKNNKKVVKKLNRNYGKGWFDLNVKSFIHKRQVESLRYFTIR